MTFRGFIAVDVPGGPVLDALAGDLEKASPSLKVVGTHTVDSVHLKKSVLTPQGAQYSVVETVRLGE